MKYYIILNFIRIKLAFFLVVSEIVFLAQTTRSLSIYTQKKVKTLQ